MANMGERPKHHDYRRDTMPTADYYRKISYLWSSSKVKVVSFLIALTVMFLIMASYNLPWNKTRLLITPAPVSADWLRLMVVRTNTASTDAATGNNSMDTKPFILTSTPSTTDAATGSNSMETKPFILTSPASTTHAAPGNNPIDMKLLVKTISSKLEYAPRKMADEKDMLETDSHLFSVVPHHFLPDIKSPCWYKEYSKPSGEQDRNVHQQLHDNDGKTFRLRCLPFFYIIGQPKCGTTDLYNRMSLHPEIKFSAAKEPHWWTRSRFRPAYVENQKRDPVEDYLGQFHSAAQKIQKAISGSSSEDRRALQFVTGEASASTMWDNRGWYNLHKDTNESEPTYLVQDLIHKLHPSTKIITILRDPVERLYSDYLYFKSSTSVEDFHQRVVESIQLFQSCLSENSLHTCAYKRSFIKTLSVRLHLGFYVVYLLDWLTVFHREQILVIQLENYSANLRGTLKKVFDFLDVGPLSDQQETTLAEKHRSNTRSTADKNLGPMLPATRDLLREFHQPFNQKLASLLDNQDFLWNNT